MLTNSLCIIFRKSSAFTRSYIYCTVTEQQLLELFSHQESSDFTRSHTLYCHKTKPLEIDFIFEKYFTCRMDVFAYDIWIISIFYVNIYCFHTISSIATDTVAWIRFLNLMEFQEPLVFIHCIL